LTLFVESGIDRASLLEKIKKVGVQISSIEESIKATEEKISKVGSVDAEIKTLKANWRQAQREKLLAISSMTTQQKKEFLLQVIDGKLTVKAANDFSGTFNFSKAYEIIDVLNIGSPCRSSNGRR